MFVYFLFLLELFSQGTSPVESGLTAANSSAEQCRACHAAEYDEWRASRHSMAWSNDFFQLEYQQKKRPWCRNCHIPMVAQQGSDEAALQLRSEGVNCVTCHVRGETFFAKTKRAGSPHNTKESDDFGDSSFCAGCHQFNFPIFDNEEELIGYTEEPMQNTVAQFRAGPFAESHTCRDCHASSPGKHSYAGAHDLSMLRQSLSFDVCRSGQSLRTTLTNVGAGHNVPTGDVHRHIVVRAWRSNAPEKLQEAFYGRRFTPEDSGGKTTIWDSSLPPNTFRRWQFDPKTLEGGTAEPINLEVRYLYGSHESYRAHFKEAAFQVVFRVRAAFSSLAACPSNAPAGK